MEIPEEYKIKNFKISIVMGYYNRLAQLESTLKSIYYSGYPNIEIIIVNDKSKEDQNPSKLINEYQIFFNSNIKLINILSKDHVNPCIAYNIGIHQSTGDIIILQNPEVMYIDDIINYTVENLEENDYFSFTCIGSDSLERNDIISQLIQTKEDYLNNRQKIKDLLVTSNISGNTVCSKQNLGYLNHSELLPTLYHYCSAIFKNKLIEIGGFDNDYKDGICFDDNDLVKKIISKNKLNTKIIDKLTLHQYHYPSILYRYDKDILWLNNKKVYNNKLAKYGEDNSFYNELTKKNNYLEINYKLTHQKNSPVMENLQKILHIHLNNKNLNFINYLCIDSFLFYHTGWSVRIYKENNFDLLENSIEVLDKILLLPSVKLINFDFNKIGLNNCSDEYIKSEFIKYYLIYNHGGIFSDINIFYTNKIDLNFFDNRKVNMEGIIYINNNLINNFILGCKGNKFFEYLMNFYINKNEYINKYDNIINYINSNLSCFENIMVIKDNIINGLYTINDIYNNINMVDCYRKVLDILSNNNIFGIYLFHNKIHYDHNNCDTFFLNISSCIQLVIKSFLIRKNRRYYIDMNDFDFVHFAKLESESESKEQYNSIFNFRMDLLKNSSLDQIIGIYDLCLIREGTIINNYFDIYKNLNGCYLNKKKLNKKKISIIFTYFNRMDQFLLTLLLIEKYKNELLEIIIIDDNSDDEDNILLLMDLFPMNFKIKKMQSKKYVNPCLPYNVGISYAEGDIIILQNPEVCYTFNVIDYVIKNLNDNNYISFNCLALKSQKENQILKNNFNIINHDISKIFNKNNILWYNHKTINPTFYHFCSAITKKNLFKINGFSTEYQYGYCFDDEDLVLKIKLQNLQLIIPKENNYVIHQYHNPLPYINCHILPNDNPIKKAWQTNNNIYIKKLNYYQELSKKKKSNIPKILHTYWNGEEFNLFNYLSTMTFRYYNRDWEIKLWMSTDNFNKLDIYNQQPGSFIKYIKNISNLDICPINFANINFDNECSEKIKSLYFKYYIMGLKGGLWSELDIFYINSIKNIIIDLDKDFSSVGILSNNEFTDDLFLSVANNNLFLDLTNIIKQNYNKLDHTINFQTVRSLINNSLNNSDIYRISSEVYMPFPNIIGVFCSRNIKLIFQNSTLGIKLFQEDIAFKDYYDKLIKNLRMNRSVLSKYVNEFLNNIKRHDYIDILL